MLSIRIKSRTAILLAIIYGTVGFTGKSLHVLVEEASLALRQIDFSAAEGYFHAHHPDNHVHFHHHHHHHGGDSESQDTKLASQEDSTDFRVSHQYHHQHACPLLSVVETLKLGAGGVVAVDVELASLSASIADLCNNHAYQQVSYYLERGPPVSA